MQYAETTNTSFYSELNPSESAGLNWLVAENTAQAARRERFRRPVHELEMEMMTRPLPVQRAYALLGLFLGTVPPAMIFIQMFGYGFRPQALGDVAAGMIFLCAMMNVVCALMGYLIGRLLSQVALIAERRSWNQTVLLLALFGLAWGILVGAAGGFFYFGIGAFFGPVFAIPVGVVAFLVFGVLHRLLERGGMIEARHFLPIASGITAAISVLIAVQ
jgi:hypothetical protein